MIDLVHVLEFSERLSSGWRMVPGYPLEPGDTRVVMQSPDHDWERLSNAERAWRSRMKVSELQIF